ncbi:AKR_collapsed_G0005650.mRNA.1.CDS.1 [Saccharomyces cerevisiae]|nr:AKR_collapsed_G0005650.mRNA.1.CDS.1 [Saccharomyces cerevisiae]
MASKEKLGKQIVLARSGCAQIIVEVHIIFVKRICVITLVYGGVIVFGLPPGFESAFGVLVLVFGLALEPEGELVVILRLVLLLLGSDSFATWFQRSKE